MAQVEAQTLSVAQIGRHKPFLGLSCPFSRCREHGGMRIADNDLSDEPKCHSDEASG
jgi:hypothetical protein